MNDQEQDKRGREAQAVLGNPIYQEAWQAVRSRLLEIMGSARTDEATLEAKKMLGLLADVQAHMSRVLQDGKVAAAAIELEREQQKRKWWQRAA